MFDNVSSIEQSKEEIAAYLKVNQCIINDILNLSFLFIRYKVLFFHYLFLSVHI